MVNRLQTVDEGFQRMEQLIEPFLRSVYELDHFHPVDVALFLNLLAGKELRHALQEVTPLTPEELDVLSEQQVAKYNADGCVDSSTFIGEIIGLHTVLGTRMVKLQLMMSDLKDNIPVQFNDDDPDL